MRFAQNISIPAIAGLLSAVAAFAAAVPSCYGAELLQGRAALVNGVLITSEEFQDELKRAERLGARGSKGNQEQDALAKKQLLENLIVRELLYQEAVKRGIKLPEAAVDAELEGLKKRLDPKTDFADTLGELGLSEQSVREKVARGMVVQQFIDREFAGQGKVTEAEVERYYREHVEQYRQSCRLRLSHILVKSDPYWDEEQKGEARARLESLRKDILAGDDFAQLAQDYSECYSGKKGGDLGYFLPGQLSGKMEQAALALKPGELSGVVEDRYGLHLLKVTELREAAQLPLERVREEIRQELTRERQLKALAPFVKKLRAQAKVELLLNEDGF